MRSMIDRQRPWMNEELELFADHASKFIERELMPDAARWEAARCVDRSAWRKAGEGGLLGPGIPEQYGGSGGGFAHEAVIAEALVRAGLWGGLGTGILVSCGIVAHYLLDYGTQEQKRHWLPKLASGDSIGAIAMTEPGTGSDLRSVKTFASWVEGSWYINGQKTFISNGQNADLVLVVARTNPAGGSKGVSLFIVDTSCVKGFRRGRNLEKIGMHAQDTSELFFDNASVPEDGLLGGEPHRGFEQLMQQLPRERLNTALSAAACMELAVEITSGYVRERAAFGKALLDFQNTQFKLAECKTKAVIARTFVDQLVVRLLAGNLDPVAAAMAKWWATDALGEVADECLQLHGGYGYMREYPISSVWTDARVMRIFAGTNEIMKLLIARSFMTAGEAAQQGRELTYE